MAYSIDPIQDSCYPGTTVLVNKLHIHDEAAPYVSGGKSYVEYSKVQSPKGGCTLPVLCRKFELLRILTDFSSIAACISFFTRNMNSPMAVK